VDNGVVTCKASHIVGHCDFCPALLNCIQVAIDPSLGIAYVGVDKHKVGTTPAGYLQNRPMRPRTPAQARSLAKTEWLGKTYHSDAGDRRRLRHLKESIPCLSLTHDEDARTLTTRV
jgi:hypothetical protein